MLQKYGEQPAKAVSACAQRKRDVILSLSPVRLRRKESRVGGNRFFVTLRM